LSADRGTLEVGKLADFALWDIERPAELSYGLGANPCIGVVQRGMPRT
jgi:imidazolonepropionase